MKSIFEILSIKIYCDLNLIASDFRRNYPGYWGRKRGVWSWVATVYENGNSTGTDIGSTFTASQLIKCDRLTILPSGEIFPK